MATPKRTPINLPWPLGGLFSGVVGCGCLAGVLFAGLMVMMLGALVQTSFQELWFGATSRPMTVTVTRTEVRMEKESRSRYHQSSYLVDTCHQKTFFRAGLGREHWLDARLYDGRCTMDETGKPDQAAGKAIQVRASALGDGYSLTGWGNNLAVASLIVGVLAFGSLRALWLLRRFLPPLLAWLRREPRT